MLTTSKEQVRVRIAFIDASEKGQPFGQRAKQAMSELLYAKMSNWCRTQLIATDAWLPESLLIIRTLAWNYSSKGSAGYMRGACQKPRWTSRQAQATARQQKFGLWNDPFPVPPWDWRKDEKERARMAHDAV